MKRFIKIVLIICAVTITFTLMVGAVEAGPKVNKVYWATCQAGTVGYLVPAAISPVIWKYSNKTIKIIAEPHRGNTQTVQALREKKAHIGGAGADLAYDNYYGKGFFKNQGSWDGLRAMFPYTVAFMQCPLLKKSSIKSIYDLKGKKVRAPEKGSMGDKNTRAMLRGAGYDIEKDLNLSWGTFSQGIDAVKDGIVDVFMCYAGMPSSPVAALDAMKDIKFLEIPKAVVKNMNKIFYEGNDIYKHGVVVPEGTYKGMPKGYQSMFCLYMDVTRADYDQDIVYQMTKIFWEHKDECEANLSKLKRVDKSMVPAMATGFFPIAEGALRYYKEVGWIK